MTTAQAAAFDATLVQEGTAHTHEDLLRNYGSAHTTPARTAPLDECNFYDLFMANPSDLNRQYDDARAEARRVHGDAYVDKILRGNRHHDLRAHRKGDYRLDLQQQRALQADGITLIKATARTFGELYNDLYEDDMPVFVTADSVLHAWHTSFDAFYMDMEESSLKPLLEHVLTSTLDHTTKFITAYQRDTLMLPIALDVKDYMTVALSLLQGALVPGVSKRANALWTAVQARKIGEVNIFGLRRVMDFSMMELRGHYAKSFTLGKYFQAFMWLALIELRLDGNDGDATTDLYQFRAACLMMYLLRQAYMTEVLAAYESTLDNLVGSGYGPDMLTPRKLDKLLPNEFHIDDLRDTTWCVAIQGKIRESGAAFQAVNGQIRDAVFSNEETSLPLAFTFVGQYAAWDAFALSRLVFDRVRHQNIKVARSMPSAVDLAFAVMANDAASDVIANRMIRKPTDPDYVNFRDGLPYASNLIALRQVLDRETAQVDVNTCSLTTLWVLALRELSSPSAHHENTFQTQTWKLRMMNTQIGSYMQLKHDTILTAKQPMSFMGGCSHPAAYVDPYPEFWEMMAKLAMRCSAISREMNQCGSSWDFQYPKMDRMVEFFFANFAEVMRKLKAVALAQARGEKLSKEQDEYFKAIMEGHLSSGPSRFEGWYPSLFYRSASESVKMENQVIDIFTNPPSPDRDDPGGVLHLQVSHAELSVIVVGNTMYAGPIFNHRELIAPTGNRYVSGSFVPYNLLKRPEWVRTSFATAIQ